MYLQMIRHLWPIRRRNFVGSVCQRRKLRVNGGKSRVMRCSMIGDAMESVLVKI